MVTEIEMEIEGNKDARIRQFEAANQRLTENIKGRAAAIDRLTEELRQLVQMIDDQGSPLQEEIRRKDEEITGLRQGVVKKNKRLEFKDGMLAGLDEFIHRMTSPCSTSHPRGVPSAGGQQTPFMDARTPSRRPMHSSIDRIVKCEVTSNLRIRLTFSIQTTLFHTSDFLFRHADSGLDNEQETTNGQIGACLKCMQTMSQKTNNI
jgi:hypothetical protein